jgi:trk system potassium uptake protein TrkH
MMDLRPVFVVCGLALCALAGVMLVPAVLDAVNRDPEWQVFAGCAGFTLFAGLVMAAANWTGRLRLTVRQGFLATVLGWLLPAGFAALPLAFGPAHLSAADAFFEAMSGVTGTGATVLKGLDQMPHGLLLWRGLLQWLGGAGAVALGMAVLPALSIGGMQMFRMQLMGPGERATPRAGRMAATIAVSYVGLTAVLAVALWVAGMTRLDAVVHAMTAIATGGFSTHDASLGFYHSHAIQLIATAGMLLGGVPFIVFFQWAQGNKRAVRRDQQLHWYAALLALGTLGVSAYLLVSHAVPAKDALVHGLFTVASVLTGTGAFVGSHGQWDGLPAAILFFLTFVGGCAGSTAAGIKVFRFQLLFAEARVQIRHLLRPHDVMVPRFNHRKVPDEVIEAVMGFIFVYALAFAILAMALALLGLDFTAAVSSAAAAMANLGPGLGADVGPGGNMAALPEPAKWLLACAMLFGRVEMFPVLVLFVPHFWRE